ncbi:MAG: DUF433 domain-containing protein [Pirellulaceae bacterium]|nr:DUF433 domain-containing protein [Pirellulaceae bacterium]
MNQQVATHVELRENRSGQQRAYISGTRVRIQDIYSQAEIFRKSPEQIAESLPDLTLAKVHAALSYLYDHREQIVAEMKEDETFADQLRAISGPSILNKKLDRPTGT